MLFVQELTHTEGKPCVLYCDMNEAELQKRVLERSIKSSICKISLCHVTKDAMVYDYEIQWTKNGQKIDFLQFLLK